MLPSSSGDLVVGWLGQALKVKVRGAPEKGRANKAVETLLSKTPALDSAQLQQRLAAAGIKSPAAE